MERDANKRNLNDNQIKVKEVSRNKLKSNEQIESTLQDKYGKCSSVHDSHIYE